MSQPIRIGIDLDEVLAALYVGCIEYYNTFYGGGNSSMAGPAATPEAWLEWNKVHEKLPLLLSRGHFYQLINDTWANYNVINLPPVESNVDVSMRSLCRDYNVTILTNRDTESMPYVYWWLKAYDIKFHNIVFNGGHLGGGTSKFDYPIHILLDDHPKLPEKMYKYPQKLLFVRTQPWNEQVDTVPYPNVYRVPTLEDFAKIMANFDDYTAMKARLKGTLK